MLKETKSYILIGEDGFPISELQMTQEQYDDAQAKLSSSSGDEQAYWELVDAKQGRRWADSKRTGE